MKGMELSRAYWEKYWVGFNDFLPECRGKLAAGLVGEGSECYGFDDGISQDHDFGPGFCIWMSDDVYQKYGWKIQQMYDSLPREFMGFRRNQTAEGSGRVGAISIDRFYSKYTGTIGIPKDNIQWLGIPSHFLSTATNGQVFVDELGEFSAIREELKRYYPTDVMKKKLVANLAIMAQAGQYNYARAIKRGDSYAAYMAAGEFIKNALGAIYILNREYMPFYKWAFKGAEKMVNCSGGLRDLRELTVKRDTEDGQRKILLIESISMQVAGELRRQGLSDVNDSFLEPHCHAIMKTIVDERISGLHIMVGG